MLRFLSVCALLLLASTPCTAQVAEGAADNTIGAGANYTAFGDGLVFDVLTPTTLTSVDCYPLGPGNIVVNLLDSAGATLQTSTFAAAAGGLTTVPLGFTLAVGTGYRLNAVGTTTGGLFRNSAGGAYPYNSSALISITGPINALAGYYYFWYNWQLGGMPLSAIWQENSPEASFDVNGVQLTGPLANAPATTTVLVNAPTSVNLDSTLAGTAAHEVLIGTVTPISTNQGALTTAGGQIVNISLADPLITFLYGSGFTPNLLPFPAATTLPITPTSVLNVSAQALFTNPANPDGFTLSQASELVVTSNSVTTIVGDDILQVVSLTSPVSFYGQTFNSIEVSTNGFMKFGSNGSNSDLSESADDFLNGAMGGGTAAPGIAILWEDVDMGNRASSMVRVTETPMNTIIIEYIDGDYYPTTSFGNVTCTIDSSGLSGAPIVVTLDYSGYSAAAPPMEGLVGVTDGGTSTTPVSVGVPLDIWNTTTGAVNLYTSLAPVESIFQNFDGQGTLVPAIPAEAFDLGTRTINFIDVSGAGTWIVQ